MTIVAISCTSRPGAFAVQDGGHIVGRPLMTTEQSGSRKANDLLRARLRALSPSGIVIEPRHRDDVYPGHTATVRTTVQLFALEAGCELIEVARRAWRRDLKLSADPLALHERATPLQPPRSVRDIWGDGLIIRADTNAAVLLLHWHSRFRPAAGTGSSVATQSPKSTAHFTGSRTDSHEVRP